MRFAIRVDRLIDGTGSAPTRGAAILIDEDTILDAGPVERVGIPADWPVVDAPGCTALPGLIDCHVHIANSGDPHQTWDTSYLRDDTGLLALKGYVYANHDLEAGFTTVRDMGARSYVNIAVRDAVECGLVTGPRIVACGLPLCSTGGHFDRFGLTTGNTMSDYAAIVDSPDAARASVREQFKRGADFIKIAIDGRLPSSFHPRSTQLQELSAAELRAICETVHEAGRKVAAHTDGGPGMCDAIRAGIDSLEHLQGFTEEEMALIAEHGVILVPTLTATKCTVDNGVMPQVPERLRAKALQWMVRNWKDKQAGMKRALAAGVRIALGTDAGYTNCLHGQNAYELGLFVQEGMTPMQAIVAATSTAAECVRLGDSVGTLRKGYLADILLVEGDPLKDIAILRRPERLKAIYKDGRLVKSSL